MHDEKQICGGSFVVNLAVGANVDDLRRRDKSNVQIHQTGERLSVHIYNGIAYQGQTGISVIPQDKSPFGWGFADVISILPMGSGRAFWVREHADIPMTADA